MTRTIRCRSLTEGRTTGDTLVSHEPISFFGGVSPDTGEVVDPASDIFGEQIGGRILVFPRPKGSTAGWTTLYRLAARGKAPHGIINEESDAIVASGAVMGEIPLVDSPVEDLSAIKTGMPIELDATNGRIVFPTSNRSS